MAFLSGSAFFALPSLALSSSAACQRRMGAHCSQGDQHFEDVNVTASALTPA